MNLETRLQATLATTRQQILQDRTALLQTTAMPSGLALFGLRLLETLQTHANPDEVADLLAEPDIRPHRATLRRALHGDLAALLRTLDADPPLRTACQALLDHVDGSAATHRAAAITIHVDAGGGTISGSHVTFLQHADQVTVQPPTLPDRIQDQQDQALLTYLRRTVNVCNALPLGQIDRTDAGHARPLELARVYIRLHTTSQVELTPEEIAALPEEQRRQQRGERPVRPVSVVEALVRAERGHLMLLGAPGSGKSTFVSHLTLCLAGAELCAHEIVHVYPL